MIATTAGAEVAAFTEAGHPGNRSLPQTDTNPAHSQHEVIVDPEALEGSASDLLMQVLGSDEGITGMHAEALQKGGVPFEVVTNALRHGWRNLQEQHRQRDVEPEAIAGVCCLRLHCFACLKGAALAISPGKH